MCISAQANRRAAASSLQTSVEADGAAHEQASQGVLKQGHSWGVSSSPTPTLTKKWEHDMTPSDPYERITPGMTVLDLAGDRVGKVRGISGRLPDLYRTGDLDAIGRNQEAVRAGLGAAGHVEIEYRGRRLNVPFTAVNEVREDALILAVDREAVDAQGWDIAPTTIS
jgi:hypothetical protein